MTLFIIVIWPNGQAIVGVRLAKPEKDWVALCVMIAVRYPPNGQAIEPFVARTLRSNKRLFTAAWRAERRIEQDKNRHAFSSD